jgi:DNA-binding response OmpR family regulator
MAHILLADDQGFIKEFLLYELNQMGHEVTCVKDVDTLFVFLENQTPDLVLLDPNLNGFRGWDLLREIKRPERPRVPTILFTSFEATLQDPRAALADGYVVKNVNTLELKEKISDVLTDGKQPGSDTHEWPESIQAFTAASPVGSLPTGQGVKVHGRS